MRFSGPMQEALISERLVVFVVSTTDGGTEPRAMASLWNMLLSWQMTYLKICISACSALEIRCVRSFVGALDPVEHLLEVLLQLYPPVDHYPASYERFEIRCF